VLFFFYQFSLSSYCSLHNRYNVSNGGPAPESVTDAIFTNTGKITRILSCVSIPDIDLSKIGITTIHGDDGKEFIVEVIDSVEDYAKLISNTFNIPSLQKLVARSDFSIAYDGLSGGMIYDFFIF
jgi:phosphoglucomutase